jgi:hypothetical protein
MQRFIISLAIALGILVPAVAFAQTSSTGLLTVYVQVTSQTGGYPYQQTYTPANFTVSVSGQNPSLTNFAGSQSGTALTLSPGSYNVVVNNTVPGYVPSYSVGCNYSIAAGQTQTCIITMTPSYNYAPYTYPSNNVYPYNYNYPYVQPLTCQTVTPTVALGQSATFRALGGAGGTYNWSTAYQNYPNVGPSLTIAFQASGAQSVTVTNAAQTATCTINVTTSFYPVPTSTTYPTYPNTYPGTTYPGTYPGSVYPTQTQTYYPAYPGLPRTGFAPRDLSTGIAFAAVLLIAAGLALSPYARKAVAIISR